METLAKYKISKDYLIDISKKIIGQQFQLSEHTDYLYTLVSLYLCGSPDFEKHSLKAKSGKEYPFSLKKGLFLISAPGAGKSFVFEDLLPSIFKYIPTHKYRTITVYQLQELYQKYGAFAIDEYNNSVYTSREQKTEYNIYIDDLGREKPVAKHYAQEYQYMNMFFDARVRLLKRGFKTHASSNLNVQKLKEFYSDPATFSRMFALFNFIIIDNKIDYRIEL